MMPLYEQFMDLKAHAAEMNQTPSRWVVGPGVVEVIKKHMSVRSIIHYAGEIEYLGVPVERSVDLPKGRVTLMCGQWSAGSFTIEAQEV